MKKTPLTRGERVIKFIETYCVVPEGALVGLPLKLIDFQKKFILDIYDNPAGTRRAYLSIARKNAKTATIACILLAHLVGPEVKENAQIISGAMSREQAGVVFDLAAKMVRMSPKLSAIVKILPSGKRLKGLTHDTLYKALSAEAATAHGLSPVLAILDEVGQIRGPQNDFVDAITTAQGAHSEPLLIALSTQAANDADLFSVWLDDAASSGDPRIVSHVYSAPQDADILDRTGWYAANPALGVFRSLQDVEEQALQASRMPSVENTFRNLILNQRVSVVSPFVSRDVWKAGDTKLLPFDKDTQVFGGLDLSKRTDLTAFVLIGMVSGRWQAYSYFWAPEDGVRDRAKRDRTPYDLWASQGFIRLTPGKTVDYAYVAREIADLCEGLNLHSIAYDKYRMDVLRKAFDDIGISTEGPDSKLPCVEYGQGFISAAPALDALEAELINGRIAHGGHPVLTMCAANAIVVKDSAENRKLDKSKATGRIDGMAALMTAFGATILAAGDIQKPKTYQFFAM